MLLKAAQVHQKFAALRAASCSWAESSKHPVSKGRQFI
jgi:hypothetical protein